MVLLNPDNILFLDTESDIDTKQPLSLQWRMNGEHGIITSFTLATYTQIKRLWDTSAGIVMFNAPYDLGVIANAYSGLNTWRWIASEYGGYWDMEIFRHRYRVRRISGHRNLIKPLGIVADENGIRYPKKTRKPPSAPVIDLLKLWSILVDDGSRGSISLKALIKRELHEEPIIYTPETALSDAYRYQDVDKLDALWRVFLGKVEGIGDLRLYTLKDWCFVKTPATFTKLSYKRAFPQLKQYRLRNDIADEEAGLTAPLESAYFGGITIALRRGSHPNTAWYDINGAYAHVIQYLNTDKWLNYRWEQLNNDHEDVNSKTAPLLCCVKTDAVLASINKSLKIFMVEEKKAMWYWNFDIQALRLMFPSAFFEVVEVWRPVPLHVTEKSLPALWLSWKEQEEKEHGKTTLRDYYKFLSNTSYGIKAQRKPFRTVHTNMVIAGMITARVHLILLDMVDCACSHGCTWLYSDTDSICVSDNNSIAGDIETALNKRIAPYTCECEAYACETRILSLKRYVTSHGLLLSGKPAKDKVRLHGKGRYRINQAMIYDMVMHGTTSAKPLYIGQLAANTAISMKQLVNACPWTMRYMHPFCFHTNIPSNRSVREWFYSWYAHMDTKTTWKEGAGVNDEFNRDFHVFPSYRQAMRFFGSRVQDGDAEPEDLALERGNWDAEIKYLFD